MNDGTTQLREYTSRLLNGGYIDAQEDLVIRRGGDLVMLRGGTDPAPWACSASDSPPGEFGELLRRALSRCPDGSAAALIRSPYALGAARAGASLRPMLDDMAQLIGPRLPCRTSGRVSPGLRPAVLIPETGALAVAGSLADLSAMALVIEKACRAVIESDILGGGRAIPWPEAALMRLIYLKRYRHLAEE